MKSSCVQVVYHLWMMQQQQTDDLSHMSHRQEEVEQHVVKFLTASCKYCVVSDETPEVELTDYCRLSQKLNTDYLDYQIRLL